MTTFRLASGCKASCSPRKHTCADLVVFFDVHHVLFGKVVEVQTIFFIEELAMFIAF
jgi:hypothetical protein